MQKRGQVTLFIILGVLLVAVIAAAVYYKGDLLKARLLSTTKATTFPEDVELLKDEIDSCHLTTAQEGLDLLGMQGGYIFPPEGSLQADGRVIGYAYDNGAKNPSTQTMEKELEDYMEIILPLCPDYTPYEEQFTLDAGTAQSTVSVKNDKVTFETTYPISATSGNDTYALLNPYTVTFNVRLNTVHDTVEKIISSVAKNPEVIDPEFLLTLGMPIDVLPYDDNTAVYLLEDTQSEMLIGGETFLYMFATRK